MRHPDILDAAAIAVPDARYREVVCAVVVLREGAESTPKTSRPTARPDRGLQASEHVVFVQALPRTASQKIQKFKLREEYAHLGSVLETRPSCTAIADLCRVSTPGMERAWGSAVGIREWRGRPASSEEGASHPSRRHRGHVASRSASRRVGVCFAEVRGTARPDSSIIDDRRALASMNVVLVRDGGVRPNPRNGRTEPPGTAQLCVRVAILMVKPCVIEMSAHDAGRERGTILARSMPVESSGCERGSPAPTFQHAPLSPSIGRWLQECYGGRVSGAVPRPGRSAGRTSARLLVAPSGSILRHIVEVPKIVIIATGLDDGVVPGERGAIETVARPAHPASGGPGSDGCPRR